MNNRNRNSIPAPSEVPSPAEASEEQVSAPVVDEAAAKAAEEAELKAIEEAELKKIEDAEKAAKPAKKSGKVNVIAIRQGFFKGSRKSEGDKFTLDDVSEMGEWMKKI